MNRQHALQQAFQYLNNGNLPGAGQLFNVVLEQEPENFSALNGRGFIALQQNLLPQAHADLQASLSINPKQLFAHKMLGIVLGAMGQFEASMQAFAAALALDAKDPEVYFNRANFRFQAGQVNEALYDLDAAVKLKGSYLEARSNRANLLIQLGEFARAEKDLDYLVNKITNNPDIWVALGLVRHKVGKHKESMLCNERALRLVLNHPDALLNSSSTAYEQGDYPAALAWAERALTATPQRAEVHYAKAQALMAMHRFDEAVAFYTRAIELNAAYAEAWMGRGITRARLRDLEGAALDYAKAIQLRPTYDEALNNLGSAFDKLGRYSEAIECYERILIRNPDNSLALSNAALSFSSMGLHEDAINYYKKASSLPPFVNWMLGNFQFALAKVCDWTSHQARLSDVINRIRAGESVSDPFSLLSSATNLEIRKRSSEIYVSTKYPLRNERSFETQDRADVSRLRIAYLSSDFFNHATSYLIAEMIELHDRSRFEVIGVCYGNSEVDEMRRRVSGSFDQFLEVKDKPDAEISELLRGMKIDIAVDLKGHTLGNRLGIFADRIAPVQVHYLGFPGTLGASFVDYLIADRTLIPEEHQRFYSEKIIYLPDTYQANDRHKRIAKTQDVRSDHGLPESGFVFCSFNNNWKISPDLFDVWMGILKGVENSVLWLLEDNEYAVQRLKKYAADRKVSPSRLIFAKRVPLDEHLARHRHADLFLDSFYYNAHTTASDALWAGLPVITKLGDTFSSRVCGSLLRAVGLSELIVDSQGAYMALAIELALNKEKFENIKLKLAIGRGSSSLFDTPKFTRNLEAAYELIWARHLKHISPDHIYVGNNS